MVHFYSAQVVYLAVRGIVFCKPFTTQTFIFEFAVEAYDVAVLPRRSRFDKGRIDAMICQPFDHRFARKVLTVVVTDKDVGLT